MKSSFPIKLCLVLVLVSLLGCGSGGTNVGSQTGSVTAQLHWIARTSSSVISSGKQTAAAPQGVVTVRIVVSGSDMSNVQQDFPASAGTGVIGGVPVGSNRTLTAQGLDASGVVTHQGVINNITVQPGLTTDAGIVVMNPAGQTFTVSGRVTVNGNGLPGVTVSLQGTSFSTLTGSDGSYTLTGVPNASYTVVPSLTGYTFTSATLSVPDSNGNVTGQDFTAAPIPAQTFTVSGTVTLNGSGLPGVTVLLQGTSFTTVTGSDGTYSLTGVPNGSYTVIPSLTGDTFTPTNRSVNVNNGNVTGQDFTATPIPAQTFTVSGKVTLDGSGLSGVTVLLQGTSSNSVTTGSDGTYSFAAVQNGLYTVTPSLAGDTFTPVNRSVSVNNGNMTGQDFTAALSPVIVTGAWSLFHTPQGQAEQGPDFITFTQTGNSVAVTFIEIKDGKTFTGSGTISGNNIQLSFATTDNCNNPATASLTGTISPDGNTMSGNYTEGTGSCGETGTWRMTKAQPPAFDISGSWSYFNTPQGGTEQSSVCSTLTQIGSSFTGLAGDANIFGILSGNNIQLISIHTPNASNCIQLDHLIGTIAPDGNSASGTYNNTFSGSGCGSTESGTWRATKGTCTSAPPTQGTVSGIVKDALSSPLSGVTIKLFKQSLLITTTTNNQDGTYSLTVPAGSGYSLEFSKSGYITSTIDNITISANTTTTVDAVLTTVLTSGQTRIILTWGAEPPDLDSHLTGPIPDSSSRFHIFYADKGNATSSPFAALDVDATDGFGPETTTIYQQFSGVYRFSVRDFTNGGAGTSSTALSNSGAQVKVYQGGSLAATFNVPTNQGGDVWTVFELNGSLITLINTMTFVSDETTIQSVSQRASLKKAQKKQR